VLFQILITEFQILEFLCSLLLSGVQNVARQADRIRAEESDTLWMPRFIKICAMTRLPRIRTFV